MWLCADRVSYYDDEGWWALAWIAVYDVTRNQTYLNTAESIFEDMKAAYGTTNCTDSRAVSGVRVQIFADIQLRWWHERRWHMASRLDS